MKNIIITLLILFNLFTLIFANRSNKEKLYLKQFDIFLKNCKKNPNGYILSFYNTKKEDLNLNKFEDKFIFIDNENSIFSFNTIKEIENFKKQCLKSLINCQHQFDNEEFDNED